MMGTLKSVELKYSFSFNNRKLKRHNNSHKDLKSSISLNNTTDNTDKFNVVAKNKPSSKSAINNHRRTTFKNIVEVVEIESYKIYNKENTTKVNRNNQTLRLLRKKLLQSSCSIF